MLKTIFILGLFDLLKKKEESVDYYIQRLQDLREEEIETLINLGAIYADEEKFDESLQYLEQALIIYKSMNDEVGQAFVLDTIGDVYLNMRRISTALEYYQEAFKLYSSAKSLSSKEEMLEKIKEVEKIRTAVEIVDQHKTEEIPPKFPVEEEYVADFQKISDKLEELIKVIEATRIYDMYFRKKDAMDHLQEAYTISKEIGDDKGEAALLLMMGNILLREENVRMALNYFKDAHSIFDKIGDETGKAIALLLIGTVYFILGDMGKVSASFRKSVEKFQELGDKNSESMAIELLNTLYNE
ncbi:MAG: tetratricopeptide repeat protein [Methanomicrobiales archaeon]